MDTLTYIKIRWRNGDDDDDDDGDDDDENVFHSVIKLFSGKSFS